MAKGISICKKCGKEFKWYRNPEQGPAKYCSKRCKDEDHSSWCPRTTRQTLFTCEDCGKEFKRYTSKNGDKPRFCSKTCMNKNIHTWNSEGRYRVAKATKKEKLSRLKELYEKQVIRQEACWDWKGTLHRTGYAVIQYDGKQIGAHKASWLIHKGALTEKLWVLHKCDNKKCTNPEHLYLGSPSRNSLDREERQRRPIKRGIFHPNSKLTDEQVLEIKKLIRIGVPMTKISRDFKISYGSIEAIKNRKTWKHVKEND